MPVIVISPYNVINFPAGGGHFWVYMQYALGLRKLGFDVYWLEKFRETHDERQDAATLQAFREQMKKYCFSEKLIIYNESPRKARTPHAFFGIEKAEAEAI